MPYSPEEVAFTLSYRCNLQCSHCIVSAGPQEKEVIDSSVVSNVLNEAKPNNIKVVHIYGGEPFLFQKDILPEIVEQALSRNLDVIVNTNGFWGKDEASARNGLQNIQDLAARHKGRILLGVSVDQYHQPEVPVDFIANIIAQYRFGDFPNLFILISSFSEQESKEVLNSLTQACEQKDIYLLRGRREIEYMYPALAEELLKYGHEEHVELIKLLKLEEKNITPADLIKRDIGIRPKLKDGTYLPSVPIPVMFNTRRGIPTHIAIPIERPLIGLQLAKVICAGRAKKGVPVGVFNSEDAGYVKTLFFDSSGRAFACPAQMRTEEGVQLGNKPLSQVIHEVEKSFK